MKCFHHELRRICRVVSPVCIVQQFYIILFFAKDANDCERASERARARSYQRKKLNLNENHFLGNIHVTKRSVREIDRCEKNVSYFFSVRKKTYVLLSLFYEPFKLACEYSRLSFAPRTTYEKHFGYIQVDKYWITYCGLSLVDMNCSVLTSVSVDMLIIAELFVKKKFIN